jgi:hypothetical protein
MYTGQDPYRTMEVKIHTGEYKLHQGDVLATRIKDGVTFIDVRTTTKLINVVVPLEVKDVSELQ